ncbi:hypothetical protein LCI18_015307 [Fusarium solani-melongenae]|uniref:Uncharacterized protein n=1 Tax=Fusarium solani subsp. cucurbitae TaxID=2747967 RepID=A0ACD3ZT01_FUSSC|nr:hypothetical protein LCI18_015307 [Fusarium solani-melongenae]
MKNFEKCEPVSFTKGFLENETELGFEGKVCLAVVLSYAFLDFCGQPWFPRGWTKDGLYLMQHGRNLFLKPFLVRDMAARVGGSKSPATLAAVRATKLLHHGILLMEIFRQDALRATPKPDGKAASLRDKAQEWSKSIEWDLCERFGQAVEAYIKGELVDSSIFNPSSQSAADSSASCSSSAAEISDEEFAGLFCDRILGPLEADFSSQVSGALRWFQKFEADTIQKRLPKRVALKDNPIKFAVLDTGIDLANNWIPQRKGRIQCWPSKADCEDVDGHGTHVAHLLLRLAPHAHLRISKVSKTRLLKDANIRQIADVSNHLLLDGQGPSRRHNLSFGFPNYVTKLNPILTAIRTARASGVVIFAAAGNEGGNQGVFWPAALHDGADVIRINSSDGDGVPSGFNPNAEGGRRICTLGEGVPSCQPDPDNPHKIMYRSGTSFATPIAAAIAAIILGFIDKVDFSEFTNSKDLLPRLCTAFGMGKVLCETCASKRSGFSYITPWCFLEVEEKIRVPLILNILAGVPESPVLYN